MNELERRAETWRLAALGYRRYRGRFPGLLEGAAEAAEAAARDLERAAAAESSTFGQSPDGKENTR